MINLEIDPKIFNPIYLEHMLQNNNRYQIYFGGSSSGKSFSIAQRIVLDVLNGRNYLVVRHVQSTIKRSCFNEINKAISNFKVKEYFEINKSDLIITCTLNNRQILFAGLDDVDKIKSISPKDSVLTDVFVEEATECEYKAIKQLNKRLRGKSEFIKRITLAFNPVLKSHWIYKEYFGIWEDDKQYVEGNNVSILKTTYKDNKFLTNDDIDSLENETDKYYFEVYTLGNWGILGAVIFKNWEVRDLSNIKDSFDNIRHGLDWGFSQDPNALVCLQVDNNKKELYIYDELYVGGMTNKEIADTIESKVENRLVICDSSEPKSIEELRRYGINAKGAEKGKGSIEFGIKKLQEYNIIIDISCVNAKNEFQRYKYKEDKNGNVLPIPVDKDNHLMGVA